MLAVESTSKGRRLVRLPIPIIEETSRFPLIEKVDLSIFLEALTTLH